PLNLTPMIDVVFLLVIFFMTATQFAEVERAVDLELPTVDPEAASVASAESPRVVTVMADGSLLLDGETASLDTLTERLRIAAESSASPEAPEVLIQGDARSDFQQVAEALAACRVAGVTNVGVSVESVVR
ncbi:MAG: biopolymer transporter ExbD, partial [Planctomycetota bacterium]